MTEELVCSGWEIGALVDRCVLGVARFYLLSGTLGVRRGASSVYSTRSS
jgi:hypothetical protein